jgi:hypothetical protein
MSTLRGMQFRTGVRNFSKGLGNARKRDIDQMAVLMLARFVREDVSIVGKAFRENQADLLESAFRLLAPTNGQSKAFCAQRRASTNPPRYR